MPIKGYRVSPEHKQKIMKNIQNLSKESEKKRRMKIALFQKGRKRSMTTRKKIGESKKGNKNYNWMGDKVGYSALHSWVYKTLGKADHCEECGLEKIPEGKQRYFNWANLSQNYKRDLDDWKQLCVPCHRKFDHINEKTGRKGRIPWNKGVKR